MNKQIQGLTRPKRMRLPLKALKTEPDDFQFREFEVSEDHVRTLADAAKAGAALEPMTVWKRGEADYVVVDGHHRHAAYEAIAHAKPVPVIVHECSEREAILLALSENTKTKLPMTKTERDNAAWRLVSSDHELSKAATVKATSVSDGTVAKMRRTRRSLDDQGIPLPSTWWLAMRSLKGTEQPEWDEDMKEQMIEARAKQLDDAIGVELGRMGAKQWEAVARVIERRLNRQTLHYVLDDLRADEEEEDFDFPF
ncbi:Nucleoid occlusion protein [Sulfitobacter sp. DSM 110093]|uniref:ParB/RepB/Spo0J family partition protein n=1 Tax=Sulfitobacter sp. DSM 110093 TaxID=2883127 RepID=UPI001FAB9A38|nr:ParB/RepB/Spo0J family partition protein [Sulfitobacter sp. DSM 110093]UOA31938.1 Nucleoid occlusion protein [Sulfitobacter sp. DSM 110093]